MTYTYYNEFEPYAAQWLRNLIALRFLPDGVVDERDIKNVRAEEIKEFTQCHFFAGIGGWPLALGLANWPEDKPVWTGSCPCQPFSVAGKQKAQNDERHLWPVWFNLIRHCRPSTVFGEQVSGAIAHRWLDDVYKGLEEEGYAVGSAVLPACSVGAPHRRDRLWFVGVRYSPDAASIGCNENGPREFKPSGKTNGSGLVAHPTSPRLQERKKYAGISGSPECSHPGEKFTLRDAKSLAHTGYERNGEGRIQGCTEDRRPLGGGSSSEFVRTGESENVFNTKSHGHRQRGKEFNFSKENGQQDGQLFSEPSDTGWWEVEPAVGRVANGVSSRVGRLRAYGNAIVPQVAAEFIAAFMEAKP